MSRFFSSKFAGLTPYVPGEQPRDKTYIKLNTNESPFPPSPKAQQYAAEAAQGLQLYSDPTCAALITAAAKRLGIAEDEILFFNGSDEALNFAFMAFCDESHPAAFPDLTYGFYSVFADLYRIPCTKIPLKEDFSLNVEDYLGLNKTIFIANPNAPTGLALSLSQIETIVKSNPDNVVVIDEAYVDFGGESAIPLTRKYENLLVIQTFSKSRSLAGGRLGFAVGCKALIADLNTLRYSTNPYNVNAMTMAAGIGSLEDEAYFRSCCDTVIENRQWTLEQLRSLGFTAADSMTNFILARHDKLEGKVLYLTLKEKGILVRHFDTPRLKDYNRITIGSAAQMAALVDTLKEILEEA